MGYHLAGQFPENKCDLCGEKYEDKHDCHWQEETKPDLVNHPPHYNFGKFEVIDVIEDWNLDFLCANVVKYVARAAHKGNEVQDLEKAAWYLNRRIELVKRRTNP